MRRGSRLLLGGLATVLATAPAPARPNADESFEASVRQLRRAVISQRDGSHLPRLFALRQLRDVTLRPFFYQLAQREQWQVQVHAILGLAEIDEHGHIDPWLVTQVDAIAQETLIANAIDLGMLGPEQIGELLDWEELQPIPRLMLVAERMLTGAPVDAEAVARLATSTNPPRVAGLASLLVAQLGDPSALSAFCDRLENMPRRDGNRHRLWLLEAVRQYHLSAALPWVKQVLRDPDVDEEVAYWGVYAALVLDPTEAMPIWSRQLGTEPSYRDRVRYGMLLLAAGEAIPASAYRRLQNDSDLLKRMAASGEAISRGDDPSRELMALIDLGHNKTVSWAMERVAELPADRAAPIYLHVLDEVQREGAGQADRIARAVQATAKLFEIRPESVVRRLETVDDDSLEQEVLLLGLLNTHSSAADDAARSVRRIGAGRADSLALLLIARSTESLGRDDLRQLGTIAAGGGRVSDGLQVQAAWLYLRHANAIDQALSRIFDDDS